MLTIKDLSASKELDRAAQATVYGGQGYGEGDYLSEMDKWWSDGNDTNSHNTNRTQDVFDDVQAQLVNDFKVSNNFGQVFNFSDQDIKTA